MEEEYIDYSCSTPIERLARDVESILRSWHINDSDRHYSFLSSSLVERNSNSSIVKGEHNTSKAESEADSSAGSAVESSNGSSSISRHNSKIRSATLNFGEKALALTLWDGPKGPGGNGTVASHLPLSLRRRCHLGAGSGGLAHGLSSLFGIGQCLSLGCDDDGIDDIVAEIQTALNIATSNCRCRIPAFSCRSLDTSPFDILSLKGRPKMISGYCNPGPELGSASGVFLLRKADKVPGYAAEGWHGLVPVLSRYVSADNISLCYVRHRYQWDKSNPKYAWVGHAGWGPSTDPLSQLICTATWDELNTPLWERADSPQPKTARWSFVAQWNEDLPTTPLSASLRCILAALIRASVLEDDVLLHHLCNPNVVNELQENDITCRFLSPLTQNLVQVMDWEECLRDLESIQLDSHLKDIFSSPKSDFAASAFSRACSSKSWLLMRLACNMTHMRTPSAMSALWLRIVADFRRRWERKEIILGLEEGKQLLIDKVFAAFLYGSELDPDLDSCLLAQKLQVFNIGVMMSIATDTAASLPLNISTSPHNSYPESTPSLTSRPSEEEFFDSVDTIDDTIPSFISLPNQRQGAHCPVHHVTLVHTDDQLYAPYLLRPLPITSDLLFERKSMLKNQYTDLNSRLMLANRFQRPRLKSDMMSFKAANPNAVFDDFLHWYGVPVNPLQDYLSDKLPQRDIASVLSQTKTFWLGVWEEAIPIPASKQTNLFDPSKEVEMLLYFLETMHPALLLNQILVLNIVRVNVILQDACNQKDAHKPSFVILQKLSKTLQSKSQEALHKLAKDVEKMSLIMEERDVNKKQRWHISMDTLIVCEAVCNVIAELEVTLSRIQSLMQKLDDVRVAIKIINRADDAEEVVFSEFNINEDFLQEPIVKEFCLRNEDEDEPCQLTAIIGDGIILALTKCKRE